MSLCFFACCKQDRLFCSVDILTCVGVGLFSYVLGVCIITTVFALAVLVFFFWVANKVGCFVTANAATVKLCQTVFVTGY